MKIVEVTEDDRAFVVYRQIDGGRLAHAFPRDILEWRAAEYRIDPKDTDTLLQIVLYEPLLDDHSIEDPKHLYNAETVEEAREYHLARIRKVAQADPIDDPDGHLDVVRRGHLMHPEALALKSAHVHRTRMARRATRARKASDPDAERLSLLRGLLSRPEMPPARDPEEGLPPDTNAMLRKDHG